MAATLQAVGGAGGIMSVTHRELNGDWAECPVPDTCELKFHLPDLSPAEASALPMHVLYPLLEVIDPPTYDEYGSKAWLNAEGLSDRAYDLPAEIRTGHNACFGWWLDGRQHREHGRPASVYPNGIMAWFEHDKRHRIDGPAVIKPEAGETEYWQHGEFLYGYMKCADPRFDWSAHGGDRRS